jgi:hypothetical protein
VLRTGRASTAGLSPLSTPDSILMCYPNLRASAHLSILCQSKGISLNFYQFVEGRSWVHVHEEAWLRRASLRAIGSQTVRRDAAPPPDVTRDQV